MAAQRGFPPLAEWLLVAMLRAAAGHSCGNGQRVTCMPVQPPATEGALAPNAYGSGYGAQGVPRCTPGGEVVYCLVDHDYHDCAVGEQPCCSDGSAPGHPRQDDITAGGATCAAQIVLDDMDASISSTSTNAHEGTFRPCMEDAYMGQFHHDWASNKGSASFTFKFDPPQSGCYLIEEHHPGSDSDMTCSQYLPSNTQLHVEYCQGLSKNFVVNQAINGGQWNEVGKLIFYKGSIGTLTLKNSPGDVCARGQGTSCFWVADAFRLTWTGSSCTAAQPERAQNPEPQSSSSGQVQNPDEADPDPADPHQADQGHSEHPGEEGTLLLRASLGGGEGGDEVLLKLEEHKGVMAATLQSHLGYHSVEITSISVSGRRLQTSSSGALFEVSFVARQRTVADPAAFHVKEELQSAFDSAGAGVVVQSVRVSWVEPEAELGSNQQDGGDDDFFRQAPALFICLLVFAVSLVCSCAVLIRMQARRGRAKTDEPSTVDLEVAGKVEDNEAKVDNEDTKKEEPNWEVTSLSTDEPPVSEEGVRSEDSIPATPGDGAIQD